MDLIPQILIIILLILLNGFFVASEFVLIALRKSKVDEFEETGNPTARFIKNATDNLESFISATQLGVTIVSLLLGWLGEVFISGKLIALLSFMPKGPVLIAANAIAIVIAFMLVTYLQIVLGELVPKTIALQKTELLAMVIIVPLTLFANFFRPFILFLNHSANLVLKFMGISTASPHPMAYSEEELKMILHEFGKGGIFPNDEVEMAENVFKLREIPIKQIMIPRTDIIAFEETTTFNSVLKHIDHKGYSRYPVYKRTIDNITGFIHVKDIYKSNIKTDGDKKIYRTSLIRKVLCVPETKKADEVLLDMRKKHIHLAVLNDEWGGTAGIVTLEDIIESLVGEIQDEFDVPIREIKRQIDGSYHIDGRASIEAVQERFRLPVKGLGYTTMGGLVFGLLGREPRINDKVQLGNIIFEVTEIEGKRVKSIKLVRNGLK